MYDVFQRSQADLLELWYQKDTADSAVSVNQEPVLQLL